MAARNSLMFEFLARDRASKTFDKISNKSDSLGKKLGGFGAAAAAAARTAAVGTAALGAGLIAASTKAAAFDKTMRKVGAISNASGQDLKSLSKLALKMGKDTVFSASQAAAAMLELAKGGFTEAQIKAGALAGTLTLAAAGELGMASAAGFLSNTLKTFGLKASDSNRAVAALAGGANASTASVESLGMALSQVGPGAKLAGQSLEETVAVLAAFDNAGVKGSDAGTSLKTMLMRLVPTTDRAKDAMAELGVKFTDSEGKFLSMKEIAQELQDGLKGLSDAQKTAALQAIFGSDAYRAAAIMADLGAEGVTKYTKATSDLEAAQKLAKVGTEGAAGAIEQFKGGVETLVIQLGTHLLPAFTAVTNFLTDNVIPGIGNFIDKAAELGPAFADGLGDIVQAIADALPDIDLAEIAESVKTQAKALATDLVDGITEGVKTGDFSSLGETIGKLIGDTLLRGVDLVSTFTEWVGGIDWVDIGLKAGKLLIPFGVGLITGFINSVLDIEMWIKIVGDHWQEILFAVIAVAFLPAKIVGALVKALSKIPFVGKMLAWLFEGFVKISKGVVKAVGRFLGRFFKAFADGLTGGMASRAVGAFINWLALLPTRIGIAAIEIASAARKMITKLGDAILRMAGFIGKVIGKVIGWLTLPFRKAGSWLIKRGKQVVIGLKNGVVAIAKTIGSWIKRTVIDPIVSRYKNAISWLVSAGKNVVRGLKNGIFSIAKSIGGWVRTNIINKITSRFAKARDWLITEGKQIISGLKNGIVNKMKGIAGWVKDNIVDPIVAAVKVHFKIHSPSRVMMELGGHLITGLISGMGGAGAAIAKTVFGDMPTALAHIVAKGLVSVEDLPAAALRALGKKQSSLGSRIASLLAQTGLFGDPEFFKASGTAAKKGFAFPLKPGTFRVGQGLGAGRNHTGQDFPAPIGTPVYSPFSGFLQNIDLGNRSYGQYANVAAGAWRFIAAHLSSFVRPGGPVQKGDLIGLVGSTGNSTGPHLHAELRRHGMVVNPRSVWKYAKGGFSKGSRMIMAGEEGPELIKLRQPARIFNNEETEDILSGDGRDRPIHIENLNVKAVGGDFSLKRIQKQLKYRGLR